MCDRRFAPAIDPLVALLATLQALLVLQTFFNHLGGNALELYLSDLASRVAPLVLRTVLLARGLCNLVSAASVGFALRILTLRV